MVVQLQHPLKQLAGIRQTKNTVDTGGDFE